MYQSPRLFWKTYPNEIPDKDFLKLEEKNETLKCECDVIIPVSILPEKAPNYHDGATVE